MADPKPASDTIKGQQKEIARSLPFNDTADFTTAKKNLIDQLEHDIVKKEDGTVIWDNGSYSFIQDDAPDIANPSLWRQSKLSASDGLF